ncbi:hypothetical protein ACROSR_17620 [Roseovarius tibetensis]|uniref:hypothetical protein n=1 Tax=Roseovarius tibetensis TaxID=2685897 RepID=UPI003D7FBC23
MTFVIMLMIGGVLGAVILYLPSGMLIGLLFILRWTGLPRAISLAEGIDDFFYVNGIRYEAPYKIAGRTDGNRWIQAILAPLAVIWKFAALGIGIFLAGWIIT